MKGSIKNLFTDNKKSDIDAANNWKLDERLVLSDKCKFDVYYLGFLKINNPVDSMECSRSMSMLMAKKKRQKAILRFNVFSLVVSNKSNNEMLLDQTLEHVRLVSSHYPIPYSWFYTNTDPITEEHRLYGFISIKEVSQRIVNAFTFALQVYSEQRVSRNQESDIIVDLSKANPSKQTLIERFQDPQSSKFAANNTVSKSTNVTELKSIPRPKSSSVKKNSLQNFSKINIDDIFNPNNFEKSPAIEIDNIENTFNAYQFDENTTENGSSIENVKKINSEFYKNQRQTKSNVNLDLVFDTELDEKSKYFSIEKVESCHTNEFGWSDQIVTTNVETEKKPEINVKEFDDFISDYVKKLYSK